MTSIIRPLVGALVAVVLSSARADVWQDCTAWYMGGGETVGAFTNGDMTDLRHAAIADSPTHGGAYAGNLPGISNRLETVYSAASGRTFENQRTIYLSQRDVFDKGTYKVYENGIKLPFAATNENYTLLMRVRLDESQPTNKTWVHVADLGYNGGKPNYAFAVRYYPDLESFGLIYHGGNDKPVYTNEVGTTMRGKWLELSITLQKTTDTKSRMRIGVASKDFARTYWSTEYAFKTSSVPYEGVMYLGGTTRNGGASTSSAAARGSYQMISYWERVLTDDEILEAFKLQGPDETADCTPALLKVGDPTWSADVFGAAIEGAAATPSLDLQDLAKIPLKVAAGQTLNLPFTVPATCTNLAQIVRLSAADGSSSASVQVKVDGLDVCVTDVAPGKTACVRCDAAMFTEGTHTLTLTRSDAGTDLMQLANVEISGSWRLGWIDDSYVPFQGDSDSSKTVLTNAVKSLAASDWASFRGTVKTTRHSALVVRLSEEDVKARRFNLRVKPYSMPKSTFDFVVAVNGEEVFRRTTATDAKNKYDLVDISFPPNSLKAGDNVFVFKTDNMTVGSSSWLRLDYFELEVGKEPGGFTVFLK